MQQGGTHSCLMPLTHDIHKMLYRKPLCSRSNSTAATMQQGGPHSCLMPLTEGIRNSAEACLAQSTTLRGVLHSTDVISVCIFECISFSVHQYLNLHVIMSKAQHSYHTRKHSLFSCRFNHVCTQAPALLVALPPAPQHSQSSPLSCREAPCVDACSTNAFTLCLYYYHCPSHACSLLLWA